MEERRGKAASGVGIMGLQAKGSVQATLFDDPEIQIRSDNRRCLSRMRREAPVRFLGGGGTEMCR